MAIPVAGNNDYFPILAKHLTKGVYDVVACGSDYPSQDEVLKFAREFEVSLPDDFVGFSISEIGGLVVEVKPELWPRVKQFDVRPFWSFCSGLWVFGFARTIPDWLNIRTQTASFRNESKQKLTPCLKIRGDGDFYAFAENGQMTRWTHELCQPERIHKSFVEVLEDELRALAERQKRMAQERSTFQ
jgi:hypothetical protein